MITKNNDPDVILHRKFREFMKLLNIYLNHFPRYEKYALCNNIRNCCYEMYGLIIEAKKRYHKKTTLTNLDIVHEKLRMLIHLAYDLQYFRFKDGKEETVDPKLLEGRRFIVISREINELGKLIGGWIRYEKKQGAFK